MGEVPAQRIKSWGFLIARFWSNAKVWPHIGNMRMEICGLISVWVYFKKSLGVPPGREF